MLKAREKRKEEEHTKRYSGLSSQVVSISSHKPSKLRHRVVGFTKKDTAIHCRERERKENDDENDDDEKNTCVG